MSRIIKLLLILLLIIGLAFSALVILAVESKPLVQEQSGLQLDEADSVKVLLQQITDSFRNRTNKQQIELSEPQLTSLVGFAQRAFPKVVGKVSILSSQTRLLLSYALPLNYYLNIDTAVLPADGLVLDYVKIGDIHLPGAWFTNALVAFGNWYTDSDIASKFVQQIEKIEMRNTKMRIHIQPFAQFLQELNSIKQGMQVDGDEELRIRTAYYVKMLTELPEAKSSQRQSLMVYMNAVFAKALQRSTDASAHKENQAAIMALAIYVGHYRFANFVGDIKPNNGLPLAPKVAAVLAQRTDLNQHFIFSAAIQLLSQQGLSIAIGEFKELMDRGNDGSGYSFVDLTADYAGVKFAQTATHPETARALQLAVASGTDEGIIFPSIDNLLEGFSKAAFTQQFGGVDSPAYQALVNEVHSRVEALTIHQGQSLL
ncbi:MAG: hypothetical protein GW763_02905 [Paraglaciecola sp.]|nr:hypothetical protein [Paraglaciecola sp.]NCT46936.1 hypothetical protein [Paraglaciecola sp.]